MDPILSGEAARRAKALAVMDIPGMGLLADTPVARDAEAKRAEEALTATIAELPPRFASAFGAQEGGQLLKGLVFSRVKCLKNACYVDVTYRDGRSFAALDRIISTDRDLPFGRYPGTHFRSGRAKTDDKHVVVTLALFFPLKSIDDELAMTTPKKTKKAGSR